MKTTVELDEDRLQQVMRLGHLKTRKAALAFALIETEKLLRLRNLAAKSFYGTERDVVDPNYDLLKLRKKEK
jgi:Arc/MetJ family transcription regulator